MAAGLVVILGVVVMFAFAVDRQSRQAPLGGRRRLQHLFHGRLTSPIIAGVTLFNRDAGGLERVPEPDSHLDRIDDGAALAHGVPRPVIATGTIGAWPLIAMMKPPFLNGSSAPVRLRVPSGKIRNELPGAQRVGRRVDRRQALLGIAALERHEAGQVERLHEHGQLAKFGLVQDAQPREERRERVEQDGRLDVAGVIHRVDGARAALEVLGALDEVA